MLMGIIRQLGWTWEVFGEFRRPHAAPLPITSEDDGWWKHEVRDSIRRWQWSLAAARRGDCQGLEHPSGVNRKATLAVRNSRSISSYERGTLEGIKVGSFRSYERLAQAGLAHSANCPFCGQADETLEHMWWQCPAWAHLRSSPDLPSESQREALPPCTLQLSVWMEAAGPAAAVQAKAMDRMMLSIVASRAAAESNLEVNLPLGEQPAHVSNDIGAPGSTAPG